MGVPFVSVRGETALQRAGVSIAMNLGLPNIPLADSPRFARNLEAAYRNGWRRYCAQG